MNFKKYTLKNYKCDNKVRPQTPDDLLLLSLLFYES